MSQSTRSRIIFPRGDWRVGDSGVNTTSTRRGSVDPSGHFTCLGEWDVTVAVILHLLCIRVKEFAESLLVRPRVRFRKRSADLRRL